MPIVLKSGNLNLMEHSVSVQVSTGIDVPNFLVHSIFVSVFPKHKNFATFSKNLVVIFVLWYNSALFWAPY